LTGIADARRVNLYLAAIKNDRNLTWHCAESRLPLLMQESLQYATGEKERRSSSISSRVIKKKNVLKKKTEGG